MSAESIQCAGVERQRASRSQKASKVMPDFLEKSERLLAMLDGNEHSHEHRENDTDQQWNLPFKNMMPSAHVVRTKHAFVLKRASRRSFFCLVEIRIARWQLWFGGQFLRIINGYPGFGVGNAVVGLIVQK